jgi:hypothetical protein
MIIIVVQMCLVLSLVKEGTADQVSEPGRAVNVKSIDICVHSESAQLIALCCFWFRSSDPLRTDR